MLFLIGLIISMILLTQAVFLGGWRRGGLAAGALLVAGWSAWGVGAHLGPIDAAPADWTKVESVASTDCARCHAEHYESWYRTYHRTMTRDASAETVIGDFHNATHDYQGFTSRFTQRNDQYFMETMDPNWALAHARQTDGHPISGPAPSSVFRVDRLVGSHWIQECLHKEPNGRYRRLPLLYHIVERRWVHTNGAFLAPDSRDFWDKSRATSWNDTCLYCHNTEPVKNPKRDRNNRIIGYETAVSELGISCAACHGPAGDHIAVNANPVRRLSLQSAGGADPTIVNPLRLSVERRDAICARCHGALVPKAEKWNARTQRDPFIPGMDLLDFNQLFHSEAHQEQLFEGRTPRTIPTPTMSDGRFWGDGTPLTTALEFNGIALSACYEKGHGELSCLSCHTMHGQEPNFMLKPRMNGNEVCLQCHEDYRNRIAEHSHHPVGTAGSECMNCHMPHQVYSLLTTHRSHRIESPHLATSLETGKPNACVMCHLDKPLGWVQNELQRWPSGGKPLPRALTNAEQTIPAGLLLLAERDARTRVMIAGAFARPSARMTGPTEWQGPLLVRAIEADRYPVVRHLAHRALMAQFDNTIVSRFDYLGNGPTRQRELTAIRQWIDRQSPAEIRQRVEQQWNQSLPKRHDPDLTINE